MVESEDIGVLGRLSAHRRRLPRAKSGRWASPASQTAVDEYLDVIANKTTVLFAAAAAAGAEISGGSGSGRDA